MRKVVRFLLVFSFSLALMPVAQAQYFGRNKVQWEKFHFKVLQTQHFDIYYYDEEADVVNDIGFFVVVVDVEVLGLKDLEVELLPLNLVAPEVLSLRYRHQGE